MPAGCRGRSFKNKAKKVERNRDLKKKKSWKKMMKF
jgi:hypothetical protein